MEEKDFEKYAQEFVDKIFDWGLFNPKLKREQLRALETLLTFYMFSKCDSHLRIKKFIEWCKNVE